jgi:tetraacyldisaccharide 4'-kinase
VVAAAAIGVPQRFFNNIQALGVGLDATYALPDHQPIDPMWLERQSAGTILITEKDAVKLSGITDPRVWIGQTTVRWWCDDINAFFERKLAAAGIKPSR